MKDARPILVVEDHVDLCFVLRSALEEEGYEVVSAPSARLALEVLGRMGRPGLILLDELLALTGERLLRRIQQAPVLYSVPIILLSAEETLPLEDLRSISPQVRGILRKPFTLEKLLEAVVETYR